MESRLKKLLEKYWEGDTSLEEEKEIKNLLKQAEGFPLEKKFFLGIEGISFVQPKEFEISGRRKIPKIHWLSIAAVLIIFFTSGAAIYRYQVKKAEREAFEQVMQAFNLIQTNMQKGTESLNTLDELKHLNTTQEIFNLKEIKK